MPKVTYIEASGKKHEIQVDTGLSIMEGAVQNSVPGLMPTVGDLALARLAMFMLTNNGLKKYLKLRMLKKIC